MKKICVILLIIMVVFVTVACGGKDTPTTKTTDSDAPVYGGSLTVQFVDFNTVFDPAMGEQYTYSLWMEFLFAPDWSLDDPAVYGFKENTFTAATATGQIAKSWEWKPETAEFTVTIRDDIYFQEKDAAYDIFGARNLTAEDVKYSYDRVCGTGSGFDETNYVVIDGDWRQRMNMLDSIEVNDTYTLTFKLTTASETKLSEMMISEINILGPEWDELTDEQKSDWHYACGTGPYILTDYVPDNHFTFVKNENYYAYDERYPENKLPYLDEIILQKYGDSTSVISSFISGNLDYIVSTAGLTQSERQQIKSSVTDCDVHTFTAAAPAFGLKVNQKPFNDINVRIALQKAINLEEINSAYFGLDTLTLPGLWSPQLPGFTSVANWDNELKSEYSYDPEGAKKLLAAAGYPDGFEFTVGIDAMAKVEVFQLAKTYLAEVGITMNIETLSDMMEGRELQGNKDDPRVFNFDMGASVDPGFAFQSFATTGFAYSIYAGDTHMDDLLIATRDAMTIDEQDVAAREAEEYFVRQHWYIVMSGLVEDEAFASAKLGGLQNGELMSAYHFFKAMSSRIWDTTAE
jgi:peptide/nickel transport system substrate-binding protein